MLKQKSLIFHPRNNSKNRESWRVNGLLTKEYVRCGKTNCRCNKGMKHGWYWYLMWHDKYKWRRRYVKRKDLDIVRSALNRGHEWHDRLITKHRELKSKVGISIELFELAKQGYELPTGAIEGSAITMRNGIEAMKLIKSRYWYYLCPDHMARLEILDWIRENIWGQRIYK